MTDPVLKTEGYLINTLHLDRCDTAFVCEYFSRKAREPSSSEFLRSLPIVLALENAGDLHGFDFRAIRDYAAGLGFNVAGLSSTSNPKIALFIKTWKLPVFMTRPTSAAAAPAGRPVPPAPAGGGVSARDASGRLPGGVPAPSTVKVAGLNAGVPAPAPAAPRPPEKEPPAPEKRAGPAEGPGRGEPRPPADPAATLIHTGNIRSGASVDARNKSLVVLGNVGDGAEIAADDCVYVFGSARGRIRAGGRRNTGSVIYCSDFRPQLVAIAGIYSTIENMPQNAIGRRVLVSLRNNALEYKIQD